MVHVYSNHNKNTKVPSKYIFFKYLGNKFSVNKSQEEFINYSYNFFTLRICKESIYYPLPTKFLIESGFILLIDANL